MLAPLVALAAAGAVLALAAWRSSQVSARQGVVPPAPARPLPAAALLDARATRVAAQLAVLAALIVALLAPTDASEAVTTLLGLGWALLLGVSAVVGPVWPAASPLRLLPAPPPRRAASGVLRLGVWPAAGVLAGVAWVVVVAPPPAPLVPWLLVGALSVGAAVTWTLGRVVAERLDPAAALVSVAASLAPLTRQEGGWVLRSPVATVVRRAQPRGARALLAVVTGGALAHLSAPAAVDWLGNGPTARTAVLVAAIAVAAAGIRLAAIRPYLLPAMTAAAAGWALAHHAALLSAGVGATQPVTATVSVAALLAGHLVAVAAAHRAALGRHDLRAARAVQFPLRAVLAASAAAGGWLLTASLAGTWLLPATAAGGG